MADTKGSALPAITVLVSGDELIAIDQGGSPAASNVTVDVVTTYVAANILLADTQAASTPLAALTTGDKLFAIDDPTGSPVAKNVTIDAVMTYVEATLDLTNIQQASGAIDIVPAAAANFAINSTDFVVRTTNGRVGIGTAVPAVQLDGQKTDAGNTLGWRIWNKDNTNSASHARHQVITGGTASGDAFMYFAIQSDTDWTIGIDNSDSQKFKLGYSLSVGTDTVMTWTKTTGRAGIGESAPGDKLHIKVGTADAVECLQLEQLDVSEGFCNFVATSAASTVNPLTSFTSGASIQGFLRVEINGTDRWIPFYDAPTS